MDRTSVASSTVISSPEAAIPLRGVADRSNDISEPVRDATPGQLSGPGVESRADVLHEPDRRVATLGVGIPVVDDLVPATGLLLHAPHERVNVRLVLTRVSEGSESDGAPTLDTFTGRHVAGRRGSTTAPRRTGRRERLAFNHAAELGRRRGEAGRLV